VAPSRRAVQTVGRILAVVCKPPKCSHEPLWRSRSPAKRMMARDVARGREKLNQRRRLSHGRWPGEDGGATSGSPWGAVGPLHTERLR